MTSGHLSEALGEAILTGVPLQEILSTLRAYRQLGVTRPEVQATLEALRDRTRDEAVEDRILEVMDVVSGFCSRDQSVWDDSP